MKRSTKVKLTPFRSWYYGIPAGKLAETRNLVIKYCGINVNIFYRWLGGITPVPVPAQIIINQVAGERIFEVEEPVCIKES